MQHRIFKRRTSVKLSQKTVTTQLDPRQWVFPGNWSFIFWAWSLKGADLSKQSGSPSAEQQMCKCSVQTPPLHPVSSQVFVQEPALLVSLSSSHSHAYYLGLISYSAPLFLPLIVLSSCCLLCWVIIIRSQHPHPSSRPPTLHPLVLRIMACSLSCDGRHQSTYFERRWTLQPQTPTSDQPGSFLFPHGPLGLLEQWWDSTIAATIECKGRY